MFEVDLGRLDTRERERWRRALDERPILEDRVYAHGLELGVAALLAAFVYVYTLNAGETLASGIVRALSAGAIAAVAVAATWSERVGASHRAGRFLFAWGYVEALGTRLRVVPGVALSYAVKVGPIGTSGAGPIEVTLRAEGWSTRFVFRGGELDVPTEALEALATRRIDLITDGYRDAPRTPEGARVGRGASWHTRGLVAASVAAIVGAGVPAAANACAIVERRIAAERSWHEEIGARLREPYRTVVQRYASEALAGVIVYDRCAPDGTTAAAITRFAIDHAEGRPTDAMRSFHAPVAELGLPLPSSDAAPLRLTVDCTWTPRGMSPHDPARALVDVHATWTLAEGDHPRVERALDLDGSLADDMAWECPLDPDLSFDRIVRIGLEMVRVAIEADVLTDAVRERQQERHGARIRACVARRRDWLPPAVDVRRPE